MFEQTMALPDKLPEGVEIQPSYYDEAYYAGLPKANWDRPYTWENTRPTFADLAAFLLSAFPETTSFLDVGCARGFLMRALAETAVRNKMPPLDLFGFDHSHFAVATADDKVRHLIARAGVDDFVFSRGYEVMLCLDLFEHLTPAQAERFLARSRRYVGDCCFFMIATDNENNRLEPSHITLRNRSWWHEMFLRTGWVFDKEMRDFLGAMYRESLISTSKSEAFVYSSGRKGNGTQLQ